MNNFKEWFVKSVLVRAEHRDERIERMEKIMRQLDFCYICNEFLGHNTYEYYCCDFCGRLTCSNCKNLDKCVECYKYPCEICSTKFIPGPDLLNCSNCGIDVCKECVVYGSDVDGSDVDGSDDFTWCSKECKDIELGSDDSEN
jgi:hypothetical protein